MVVKQFSVESNRIRKNRCENCQHFAPAEGRDLPTPTCRKNLPSLLASPAGNIGGVWTPTKPEYFCGQWEGVSPDAWVSCTN